MVYSIKVLKKNNRGKNDVVANYCHGSTFHKFQCLMGAVVLLGPNHLWAHHKNPRCLEVFFPNWLDCKFSRTNLPLASLQHFVFASSSITHTYTLISLMGHTQFEGLVHF